METGPIGSSANSRNTDRSLTHVDPSVAQVYARRVPVGLAVTQSRQRRRAMALSVGFIGVGNMGNPMAGNVLKAGFSMTVFDMNPKAMEDLVHAVGKPVACCT